MRRLSGIASSCALVSFAQPAVRRSFVLTKALSLSAAALALATSTLARSTRRHRVLTAPPKHMVSTQFRKKLTE